MEKWNRQVSPQERAGAISKLQRFLLGLVGDGPDAVTRATDLANKFEQHVFTSTTTRDEYLKVIIQRMQQVQRRHSSDELEGLELSEHDQMVVQQKMVRLRSALPMMERLLARCSGLDAEMVKVYVGLRDKVQKQLELLPRRVFLLSVVAATTLVDQVQHYTNEIAAILSEQRKAPKEIVEEEECERNLISWINSKRFQMDEPISSRRTCSVSRTQVDLRNINVKVTKVMLTTEMRSIQRRHPDLLMRLEQCPWGYSLHCRIRDESLGIELPADYPSERFHLTSLHGTSTANFVATIEDGGLHIFPPVSLTTLLNVYIAQIDKD
ncbi:hypothetical protein PSACC_02269 [Paramicrosporidium saccamoebae]|uniref:Mediator complex subunit 15 KIX domain-containing protein n=1 Tax=Paramicrosporidium saccamoebae TaxID=1246581 RepID=A0A2H9TJQ3_9FUNG|nr:hypothetical protein PSACC_02269 [Paramicrosporidium saccamoebae]